MKHLVLLLTLMLFAASTQAGFLWNNTIIDEENNSFLWNNEVEPDKDAPKEIIIVDPDRYLWDPEEPNVNIQPQRYLWYPE